MVLSSRPCECDLSLLISVAGHERRSNPNIFLLSSSDDGHILHEEDFEYVSQNTWLVS
jgi:hypothetical protein